MNDIVKSILEEMEACYPNLWKEGSPDRLPAAKRAVTVGKIFRREWEEYLYRIKFEKLEAEKKARAEAEKKEARKTAALEKKREAEKVYHKYWSNIVHQAEGIFGDCLFEYCRSEHPDLDASEVSEKMSSGAWEPTKDDEDSCMREALFSMWSEEIRSQRYPDMWVDKAVKYWRKNYR